jgi:hypothetical protein
MVLMKRTKFIILTVAAALILMGAGYAAWMQIFTIDSSVSTGELFVQVTNVAGSNVYEVVNASDEVVESGSLDTTDDYLDLSVSTQSVGADTDRETLTDITYTLSKMYPGTRVISQIKFENLGTLRTVVKYSDLVLNPSAGNALWNDLVIKIDGVAVGGSGAEKHTNLADAIKNKIGILEPGNSITVEIVQELPYSSTNSTEDLSLTWTVPLTFEQYNG